ncbi:MAG: iron transporter [Desulfobacterales bacterium]|nr:iron transporter [Desulfobacterales bacterium]
MESVKKILHTGIGKGWRGFIWMLKIIVPVSFFVLLLQYSGWLHSLDFLLEPAMQVMGLPAVAALPLIVGMLTGIYGGIAAMIVLPLTQAEMTLIAIFLLISHSLIQEGIIQGKSGINPIMATVIRLAGSVVTVIAVSCFLPTETGMESAALVSSSTAATFAALLKKWCVATAWLALQILVIIVSIMVTLEAMKTYKLIDHLVRGLNPILKILGLDRNVGMLWLAAAIFGIAYGGAVIIEEIRQGHYDREELKRLHLSIGINHSMIEDPLLFLPLGIGAFWLWIPRLLAAVAAVNAYNFFMKLKKSHRAPVEKTG